MNWRQNNIHMSMSKNANCIIPLFFSLNKYNEFEMNMNGFYRLSYKRQYEV